MSEILISVIPSNTKNDQNYGKNSYPPKGEEKKSFTRDLQSNLTLKMSHIRLNQRKS